MVPETCPQGSARRTAEARFDPFPASFDSPGRRTLVEALPVTEVLRWIRQDRE
jgi:hypothetical protein